MIDKNVIISYINSGLSVIPLNGENDKEKDMKAPAISSWSPLQKKIMSTDDIDYQFKNANFVGIIGGKVSGGLEVIDFDNHDGKASNRIKSFCRLPQSKILPREKTISGGYHFFYRTNKVEGNLKLAMVDIDNGRRDTIIETRGEGGYVVVSPSKGYSMMDGDLTDIPLISDEDRDAIIDFCKSFNEVYVEENHVIDVSSERRPGDDYNVSPEAEKEVRALLKRNGWKESGSYFWVRPGKETKDGISATFGRVRKDDGTPLFYVFSSNAPAPFEPNKSYSPFTLFSMLAHGGDFKAASRELCFERGYGDQRNITHRRDEVDVLIDNRFKNKEEEKESDEKKEKKRKKSPITEAKEYIEYYYDLRLNVINNKIEIKEKDSGTWDDINENNLYCQLNEYGIRISLQTVKSILGSSFIPQYNAFEEMFMSIPVWDGIDYIDDMLKYMNVDDPIFFHDMLLKHMVRAIKCSLEDEYYNRMVFVLQSKKQEIGKSRWIRWIHPFIDGKYFSEEKLSDNKDCLIQLSENFIYNLEELDDLKNNRVSSIKALLAKSTINVRRPYGSQATKMPRRCTFFASTNFTEFLIDDVNTRWLIFNVDYIDEELFSCVNPLDLWAQAWAMYNDLDFNFELNPAEKLKREQRNDMFKESIIEEEMILEYFEPGETSNEYLSVIEIIRKILLRSSPGMRINQNASYISNILDNLGFPSRERKVLNKTIKTYAIREKSYNKPI